MKVKLSNVIMTDVSNLKIDERSNIKQPNLRD